MKLKDLGFKSCNKDVYLYTWHTNGYLFLLAIYVDNLVIASKFMEQIVELKGHLQKKFSLKSIGEIDYVFKLKVERNREHNKLKLS